jgi:hypothetical protein
LAAFDDAGGCEGGGVNACFATSLKFQVGAGTSSDAAVVMAGVGDLRLGSGGLTGLLKLVDVAPVPSASSLVVSLSLRRFAGGTLLPLGGVICGIAIVTKNSETASLQHLSFDDERVRRVIGGERLYVVVTASTGLFW